MWIWQSWDSRSRRNWNWPMQENLTGFYNLTFSNPKFLELHLNRTPLCEFHLQSRVHEGCRYQHEDFAIFILAIGNWLRSGIFSWIWNAHIGIPELLQDSNSLCLGLFLLYFFLVKFTKVAQNVSEKFFLQLYEHDWPMLENCTGWIITIRRPPFLLLEFELDRFSNMCELQLQSAWRLTLPNSVHVSGYNHMNKLEDAL